MFTRSVVTDEYLPLREKVLVIVTSDGNNACPLASILKNGDIKVKGIYDQNF